MATISKIALNKDYLQRNMEQMDIILFVRKIYMDEDSKFWENTISNLDFYIEIILQMWRLGWHCQTQVLRMHYPIDPLPLEDMLQNKKKRMRDKR